MNKQLETLKTHALIQLEAFIKGFKEMNGKEAEPRDFDAYMSGYIGGITYPEDKNAKQSIQNLVFTNSKELINHLVKSEIAKSIGVTGTEKEKFALSSIE